mmetsp:Transcript_11253/g.23848  ORF Transcript_11253/g.23848 Transcript_11253/m.23848 type:complete len:103 (-) Transcript_11253:1272-1580(-)
MRITLFQHFHIEKWLVTRQDGDDVTDENFSGNRSAHCKQNLEIAQDDGKWITFFTKEFYPHNKPFKSFFQNRTTIFSDDPISSSMHKDSIRTTTPVVFKKHV